MIGAIFFKAPKVQNLMMGKALDLQIEGLSCTEDSELQPGPPF